MSAAPPPSARKLHPFLRTPPAFTSNDPVMIQREKSPLAKQRDGRDGSMISVHLRTQEAPHRTEPKCSLQLQQNSVCFCSNFKTLLRNRSDGCHGLGNERAGRFRVLPPF